MSELFQSFTFSEHQIDRLEQENCDGSNKDIKNLDVIEESPTNQGKSFNHSHKSLRERLRQVKMTQKLRRKQVLKKNKSDSVLGINKKAEESRTVSKNSGVSDFFNSNLNISGISGIDDGRPPEREKDKTMDGLDLVFSDSFNIPTKPEANQKYDDFFQDSVELAHLVSSKFDTPAKDDLPLKEKKNQNLEKISEELAHLDSSDFELSIRSENPQLNENLNGKCDIDKFFDDSEGMADIKTQDLLPPEKRILEKSRISEEFKNSYQQSFKKSVKFLPPFLTNILEKSQQDQTLVTGSDDILRDTDNISFYQQSGNDLEASSFLEGELKIQKSLMNLDEDLPETEKSIVHQENSLIIMETSKRLSISRSTQLPSNKNESMKVDTTKNLLLLANWNLPQSVVNEYRRKKVEEMFEWQRECLMNPKVLFELRNLVYSAPTSAGKTLVSEILMIKNIKERRKKALFILPFISVVREKMFYLQDLLSSSGIRVEGMFGGYHPAGSFDSMDLIVLTIEKANAIVNRLLEQNKLGDIGMIVIDEVHLISDSQRGYILELLLTKVLYFCQKFELKIQIVTMSATLPNLELLTSWLDAEIYQTDFRPIELHEMIKIGNFVYNNKMEQLRSVENSFSEYFGNDSDDVSQLCMETLQEKCQLIIFCPSKDWVEKLSHNLAGGFRKMIQQNVDVVNEILDLEKIREFGLQAKSLASGVDSVLEQVLRYGVAFHHAGLTTDERDLIEMGFKEGIVRILVATSTLSSGVNLPARRVIIRTPMFAGKMMSNLTYKQMIGRAGRKGRDVLGESILICNNTTINIGKQLISAPLDPLKSCLNADNHAHLKRALLEIIASGAATTKSDLENFVNLTLFSKQNQQEFKFSMENDENLKEMIRKNKKITSENILDGKEASDPIQSCISFLLEFEFIRLQLNEETDELNFVPTRLGIACLASSMPPSDGFLLFSELQKSRQNFVLESDLHAIYLVTPYSVSYQLQNLDWMSYFDIWDKLPTTSKRVGEMVGIKDVVFMRAIKNPGKLDYKTVQIHKRFYTALALQELVNEKSISEVAIKYKCPRGLLQNLQQTASTFAGTVTSFCQSLNWNLMALILGQFKERLFFGIHPDLIDLMKLPNINSYQARALYKSGIEKLVDLANSKVLTVENILLNTMDFDSDKKRDGENEYEAKERIKARNIFLTGKSCGVTVGEAAKLLIEQARSFVENELGTKGIKWDGQETQVNEEKVETADQQKESPLAAPSTEIPSVPNEPKISRKRAASPVKSDSPSKETPSKKFKASKISPIESKIYRKKLRSSLSPKNSSPALNTSDNEIASSQSISPLITQRLRSRMRSQLGGSTLRSVKSVPAKIASTLSADLNDSMFQNSFLMRSPVETNDMETATATVDPTQRHLNILSIASEEAFELFVKKLANQKEVSLSVGVAKNQKNKNVIGSNLFGEQKLEEPDESQQFVFDKYFYIDTLCFNFEKNDICCINMQEVPEKIVRNFLVSLLSRSDLTLSIFEAKEQLKVIFKVLSKVENFNVKIQDPKLANWLLDPDADLSLQKLVEDFAPKHLDLLNLLTSGCGKSSIALNCWTGVEPKFRASVEVFLTSQVMKPLSAKLTEVNKGHLLRVFRDLEMPIQLTLAKMEFLGFPVNSQKLIDLIEHTSHLLRTLEQRIYALNAGRKFNLSSSKEVGKVVGIHKNQQIAKHKKVSTSKQVLEKLEVPIAKLIIQYRTLSTTVSNMQSLAKLVTDSRIFANSFSFTQTGRITMHEPNLQNVTKDFVVEFEDARGKLVMEKISFRSTFEVPNGFLLSADFCQLEMRILTHLSQDKNLVKIMQTAKDDIFKMIAAKWNNMREEDVSDAVRSQAKQICYGIIYGMGMKSLAENMKVEEIEASKLCEEFHATYPGIRKYSQKIVKIVQEKGYVETMTGRRRNLPEIRSECGKDKSKAERQALNTSIQGSAADLVKNAILRMEKQLRKQNLQTKISFVLHIHDELIYQVTEGYEKDAARLLKSCMENSIKLSIPLKVKTKLGRNWGSLSEIVI